jgi:hypothetical protein
MKLAAARRLVARAVHQVLDASVISTPEGGSILITLGFCYRRVTVFIAILDVGLTVIFEVFAGSLDSFVKAATADFVVVAGRGFPCFTAVVLM